MDTSYNPPPSVGGVRGGGSKRALSSKHGDTTLARRQMQGAEERRLRMEQYAARRSERLPASGGKAIPLLSGTDDALMMNQG